MLERVGEQIDDALWHDEGLIKCIDQNESGLRWRIRELDQRREHQLLEQRARPDLPVDLGLLQQGLQFGRCQRLSVGG